jgi:hypothetical protein
MPALARIRIIKHEAVPLCGSFEVYFEHGQPSRFYYWDDIAGRRLRPDTLTGAEALEQARAFAREQRDKIRSNPRGQ